MSSTDSMRYTYRLRVSSTARRALLGEWDRCRWVWNECVAASQRAYRVGEQVGPAALDKMLTRARAETTWLRAGSSVPQQQIIRDFGRSRAKALKDIREGVSVQRRAGMPKLKKKHVAAPTVNYTQRGFSLRAGRLRLASGIEVRPVWSRELPAVPSSVRVYRDGVGHWYCSFVVPARDLRLVDPKHTTMDCGQCHARTKHALPLSQRTYTCTECETSLPRDKNSAHVMLVRASFIAAGVEGARPDRPLDGQAA